MNQQEMNEYYIAVKSANMSDCRICKHPWHNHLIPYSFKLRAYHASTETTHEVDACGWSAGAWDAGCSCKGYKN